MNPFVERLHSERPLVGVELRPPRADQDDAASMESWIEMNGSVRRLAGLDTAVFLTDSAVGSREEENLQHLVANLERDVPRDRICPFLTAKHTLEYCLWYGIRALDAGYPALTVLGGDTSVGQPRCLAHAYLLRQRVRERCPALALGGWANPHRDPARQVDYLLDAAFTAEFYLTQVVSHYDLAPVERFCEEARRRGVPHPGVFGVFYYRSASPKTLERLSRFLPVPARELTRDLTERGLSPDEVSARSIAALRGIGVTRVYLSNLPTGEAAERLEAIRAMAGL
ncbi:MAG: hypothetical protein HY720_14400 [Planctomycetes bacterium]|nr:hypothetical protein [Planctomycetota bacterium]